MAYVIAEPCINVKDKACVEVCPVDCIYEGETMLYIHPDECIDCGACEPVCPVKAIFAEDETPDQWKNFIELNKKFFRDNPGVKPATKAELHTLNGSTPGPLGIPRGAAGLILLQNCSFAAGTPVADLVGHELTIRMDPDGSRIDDRL